MLSYKAIRKYMLMMSFVTIFVLLSGSGAMSKLPSTKSETINLQIPITSFSVSSPSAYSPVIRGKLNSHNLEVFNHPSGIILNRVLTHNVSIANKVKDIFKYFFQFMRFCSRVNPQCVPSFLNWIWNLITSPFTWVLGFIIIFAFRKS
jgi:hypothetical protein